MDALSQPRVLTNDDIEAVIHAATSSRASPDARPAPLKDTRTQLFVGNLPFRVRWQDLKDLFRRAGTVLRADVSLGPDNRSRGYGTVLLATAEDAGRAIDLFNGYSWQNRILEVRPDRLPPDYDANHPPAIVSAPHDEDALDYSALLDPHHDFSANLSLRSLFVGNLPFHCQWQDLKDLFRRAGTIMRADVALGQDGRSRGFGTVTFATETDAERAVQLFNGYEYNGRTLKVTHDKFTQLNQLPIVSPSPASISPAPSVRSAPDARTSAMSLPKTTVYQPRQLSSLTSSNKQLSIPYSSHHLGLGASSTSTSSSPAPFDVWPQQQPQEKSREGEFFKSFSVLDLGVITRVPSTMSSYSAPAPSASRSTSMSSTKPPSVASTGSLTSSSSLASLSASTSASSNDNSHRPLSFERHRRLSATKEDLSSSPPAPSTSAISTANTTILPPLNVNLQKRRSPTRHPGPIALPPPPPVFTHAHPHSPHSILGFSPLHHPQSPLFAPPMSHHQQQIEQIKQMHGHQPQHQVTPMGLTLTPSMPPFNFLPPGPGSPNTPAAVGVQNMNMGMGMGMNPYTVFAPPLPSPIHASPLHHPHTHAHALHAHPSHPLHHTHAHAHARPAPFGITPLSPPASATASSFASASASAASATSPASASASVFANFSPAATMSPGAFWGRPGHGPPPPNPLINPAVGAPVHVQRVGESSCVNPAAGAGAEPTGYFDGAWFGAEGMDDVERGDLKGKGEGYERAELGNGNGKREGEGNGEKERGVLDGSPRIERKVDWEGMALHHTGVGNYSNGVYAETERHVNGTGGGEEAHTDTEESSQKQKQKQKQKTSARPRPRRHSSTHTTVQVPWQTQVSLPPKNGPQEERDVAVELDSEVRAGTMEEGVSRLDLASSPESDGCSGLGLFSPSVSRSDGIGNGEDGYRD